MVCAAIFHRLRLVVAGGLICAAGLWGAPAQAASHVLDNDPDIPSLSNYGGAGLLDMRTARFMPDGELSMGYFHSDTDDRYALTFQALPWAEVTFRYSVNGSIRGNTGAPGNVGQALYDRSFDLKLRLNEESDYWPQFALGLQDFLGTGVYSGEYLVGTKRFGDFDVTAGLGWGRLGSSGMLPNIFAEISDRFRTRNIDFGQGGVPLFSTYFHGPDMGLFGGIEYRTPIRNLSLKVEYSSDRYKTEAFKTGRDYSFPVNVGVNYRFAEGFDVGLSLMRGNEIGLQVHGYFDPKPDHTAQRADVPPPFVARDPQVVTELRTLRMQQDNTRGKLGTKLIDLSDKDAANALQWMPTSEGIMLVRHADVPKVPAHSRTETSGAPVSPSGTKFVDLTNSPNVKPRLVWKETPLGVMLVADDSKAETPAGNVASFEPPVSDASASFQTASDKLEADTANVRYARAYLPGEGKVVTDAGFAMDFMSFADDNDTAGPQLLSADDRTVVASIRKAVEAQSVAVEGIRLLNDEVRIVITNNHYLRDAEAISRTARALSATAPARISTFTITTARGGVLMATARIPRSGTDALAHGELPEALWLSTTLEPAKLSVANDIETSYPTIDVGLPYPTFSQGLFDPDNPFYFRIGLGMDGSVNLTRGLAIEAAADISLYDTFSQITRTSNSVLPHVRSDSALYLKKGKNGFSNLQASYTFQVAPEVYARVAAGYLEDMFAGAGGEILYRPFGQRWALGVDGWFAKQRDFNRLFGLQSYQIATGHMTLYYESPWYGIDFNMSVGRYLAGDYGATFEATRRFESGVQIGAWFTLTNVSAARFGEGSFDKGIIVHIPLEWIAGFATQSAYNLHLRSIQRDGGQKLEGVERLYDMTRSSSYGDVSGQWNSVFR